MRIDSNKLDLAMARACVSIAELRDKSGVSDVTLARIRRGAQEPRPSTVGRLARALGVDVRDIVAIEIAG
jgi:transcriptional regulator with XRE-family HTH domain